MSAYPIPNKALDDRLAFVGTAGSGKTYNASTGVEHLFDRNARVVVVDPLGVWWGLRLRADGSPSRWPVVIFGGAHGDLPLTEAAGALIGEAAATMAESCIVDLSALGTKAAERRFMLAFLTALYRRSTGEPVHLVMDEADMFAPQRLMDKDGDAAKLLGMMETIVRRGRIKGFVPWLITQRPAVLSKDVLSQADGLVAFKLTSSQDRAAIGAWIEGQADQQQGKAILASLPQMQRGQGVVWIPGRGILETASFPVKVSFDSSRTPKRGETLRKANLQPLDVGKLKDRLAGIETEAKQNDPKALRARINVMQNEIETLKSRSVAATPVELAHAHGQGFADGVQKYRNRLVGPVAALENAWNAYGAAFQTVRAAVDDALKAAHIVLEYRADPSPPRPAASTPRPAPKANGSAHTEQPKGERAILTAIAMHPNGVTRPQLGLLTGYKSSSRDLYVQRLKAKLCCEQRGDKLFVTPEGCIALGPDFEPLPTGDALREHWLAKLPEGERKILRVLCEHFPGDMPRDEIGRLTEYKSSSRDLYLQRLAARELIETSPGRAGASPALFG